MDSYPPLGVEKADDDTSNTDNTAYSAIYQLWKQLVGDTNFVFDFNQAWIGRQFELGDELTQYNCVQHSAVSGGVIYLVCQGQVRLLAFDPSLKKEVSIQLLNANQIFGGDDTFCNQYQEYRAIASSNGIVAQISLEHLDIWLQRYPALSDYFSKVSKSRQKLIFFKTLTELRSLRSITLQKLLPYFLTTEIRAGSPLITSASEGRFWLVSGEISSISGRNPIVGDSWGYKNTIESDLISRTDLSLFYLPKENFDLVAEIVPELKNFEIGLTELVKNFEQKQNYKLESENLKPETLKEDNCTQCANFNHQNPPHRWFRIYPFIQQQSSSDCGAACLAMISRYWGKRFSLNNLSSMAQIDCMGAELQTLANAAQNLGYQALAVRASLNKLEYEYLPFIAHYQGNHYIVVWQIKDKCVFISDPAIGKRWLSRREFETNYTGYALILSPTDCFYTKESETISFSRFYQFFGNYRLLLGKIIIFSILLALLGVVPAILAQAAIDTLTGAENFDSINILASGFLVFGLGRIVLNAMRQHFLDYLSNRLDVNLIADFINHTLELPLSFFASRRVGDILGKIQENPKIHRFLTRQAISTTLDGLMTIIYFGLMAYYSFGLTFVVLGFILGMMCLNAAGNIFLKKLSREYSFDCGLQNSAMVEMITGVTTIKTAVAEIFLQRRWEERFTQMIKTRQKGQKLTNTLQLTSSLIHHLGNTTVLWYGTHMVVNSQISIGEFIAFNMLMGNTINPMLALVKLWDEFLEVLISVEKLDDILATSLADNPQKPLIILPSIRGEVHFENVSFRYHKDQQQNFLQNISFQVKPGQTIGIVGASASCKSTLVNLLAGLYYPDSGRILIDGHDTTKVSPYSLRSQLGIVPQEFFLFSGSILENITLYNQEFSLEKVQAAAKLAGVHAFIQELPLGYRTIIGEGGIRLEYSEQGKIAIARALVKNPRILILDEASGSLDSQSEGFNRDFIKTLSGFRTTFIVNPSLRHKKSADNIVLLDRGILADLGTHEELMTNSRIYSRLVKQQLNM